jgi:hypothetical protein
LAENLHGSGALSRTPRFSRIDPALRKLESTRC